MSTNPTHLEQQNQTEQQNKAPVSSIRTHSGFTLWLDGLRCKLTVHAWRRRTKKARRRHSFRQVLARVPHANLIGDALYMIGFWVEYAVVCAVRGTYKVASTIGMNAARLLVTIIRPFALGIITLCEDIVEPFQVVGSAISAQFRMNFLTKAPIPSARKNSVISPMPHGNFCRCC